MGFRTCVQLVQFGVQGEVAWDATHTRPVWNVFTYEFTGTAHYLPAAKHNLYLMFASNVWNSISPVLNSGYSTVNCWVWLMQFAGDTPSAQGLLTDGGDVDNRLPINQAVYVYLASGLRGNRLSGSKRMAPISIGHVAGDELTPAALTAWQTALSVCANTFSLGPPTNRITLHPVIWSRRLAVTNPLPNPQVCVDITGVTVDKTLSSWRHRRVPTQT